MKVTVKLNLIHTEVGYLEQKIKMSFDSNIVDPHIAIRAACISIIEALSEPEKKLPQPSLQPCAAEITIDTLNTKSFKQKQPDEKKTFKIQASLDYASLRQSIIYALAEFGPQNAKQILDTISRDYEQLPLRGKNGSGLNSHLFSMKKDKILKSSENIPPIWSVNES
jgi:hypothetical protein